MPREQDSAVSAAVIGDGGRAGQYYLNALEKIGAPIIGFDTNEERANAAHEKHPGVIVAHSMQEALSQARVAYIVTPDPVRIGVVDEALNTPNIDVVVIEKPIADNLSDAITIFELTKKTGKKVIVDGTYRATPQFVEAKHQVDSGTIGNLLEAHATYHHDMRTVNDDWRMKGSGQSGYYGAASHPVDLLMHIFGENVDEVTAMETRFGINQGTEGYNRSEIIKMLLRFPGGGLADVSVNLSTPQPAGLHGTELQLLGENGEVRTHNKAIHNGPPGEVIIFTGNQPTKNQYASMVVSPAYTIDLLVKTADAWARGEIDSPYPFTTLQEGMNLISVLDAAEKSAKSGGSRERVVYQR